MLWLDHGRKKKRKTTTTQRHSNNRRICREFEPVVLPCSRIPSWWPWKCALIWISHGNSASVVCSSQVAMPASRIGCWCFRGNFNSETPTVDNLAGYINQNTPNKTSMQAHQITHIHQFITHNHTFMHHKLVLVSSWASSANHLPRDTFGCKVTNLTSHPIEWARRGIACRVIHLLLLVSDLHYRESFGLIA